MGSTPEVVAMSETVGGYPQASFADLHCGSSDRIRPVVLVDARPAEERAGARLCGSVSFEQALADEIGHHGEVWLVLSDPLDTWAADRLAAVGADVIVVAHDLDSAYDLGLIDP
ncbi:hypothetical protein EV383_6282 [Pseudonocardia sediminis]|uniref:Uncharacterized protein n=1 Tax=Pseudonocardia sediminis TaxID=1397368 RepID=A0A4Q7U9U6_PSEST|nr:hypothetical protein [Pseudonocardia sediminis]RZT75540.1 hypothetical protein EV383_6282 [Pseudonocardia sediminis]